MSIEEMQADAEQLIPLLMQKYGKHKIFLMGHSWGSILGVKIAQRHPDWLYAYIGVGQLVNALRNEEVGYAETLAKAEAVGNSTAVRELRSLSPYPAADGSVPIGKVAVERKWDVLLGGMLFGKAKDDAEKIRSLSPLYSKYDEASVSLGELNSVKNLEPQIARIDLSKDVSFRCPVFFFAGADDRTTPRSLVEEYFAMIQAPAKKLIIVERAAHYVVNEAPGVVLVDLVRDVLPLSQASSKE